MRFPLKTLKVILIITLVCTTIIVNLLYESIMSAPKLFIQIRPPPSAKKNAKKKTLAIIIIISILFDFTRREKQEIESILL